MGDVLNRRGIYAPEPVPGPIPDGHEGLTVGRFHETKVCQTCQAICPVDHVRGGWLDDAERRYRDELDDAETVAILYWRETGHAADLGALTRDAWATVPVPPEAHFYPFVTPKVEPEDDEETGPETIDVTPARHRVCGVEGCQNWAHECPLHETADGAEHRKQQRAAWRMERGLTTPREEMPSRIDRSREYANRNAARRAARARAKRA
jgi:hypothetical protein